MFASPARRGEAIEFWHALELSCVVPAVSESA